MPHDCCMRIKIKCTNLTWTPTHLCKWKRLCSLVQSKHGSLTSFCVFVTCSLDWPGCTVSPCLIFGQFPLLPGCVASTKVLLCRSFKALKQKIKDSHWWNTDMRASWGMQGIRIHSHPGDKTKRHDRLRSRVVPLPCWSCRWFACRWSRRFSDLSWRRTLVEV